MSRHRSSAVEQLLGLLFLICAGVIGGAIASARFVWRMYTEVPNEFDADNEGSGPHGKT